MSEIEINRDLEISMNYTVSAEKVLLDCVRPAKTHICVVMHLILSCRICDQHRYLILARPKGTFSSDLYESRREKT